MLGVLAISLWWPRPVYVLLSSNVALIGGNSTQPSSSYYALIEAVLPLNFSALSLSTFRDSRAVAISLMSLYGDRGQYPCCLVVMWP